MLRKGITVTGTKQWGSARNCTCSKWQLAGGQQAPGNRGLLFLRRLPGGLRALVWGVSAFRQSVFAILGGVHFCLLERLSRLIEMSFRAPNWLASYSSTR